MIPQVVIADNPEETIVLRPRGSTVSIETIKNTPAQLESLQSTYKVAFATFVQGQVEFFVQKFQQQANNESNTSFFASAAFLKRPTNLL